MTFTHYVAEVERIKLVEEINSVPFLSVLCDGSTDVSVQEQEIVYLRYVIAGEVKARFLAIKAPERPNAQYITDAILEAMAMDGAENWNLKLIALGSDGAAVMQGHRGGVIALLRDRISPCITAIHCSSHKLELAYKAVVKEVDLHKKLDKFLLDIYHFYHKSAPRRAGLRTSCKVLGIRCSIPTRVGGTRWLPHTERALKTVWRGYKVLITHLQQFEFDSTAKPHIKAEAKGYINILTNKELMVFAHFLTDVVVCLSKVSLSFQRQGATLSDISCAIEGTIEHLEGMKTKGGPNLARIEDASELQGFKLQVPSRRGQDACFSRGLVLDKLIESLKGRFADIDVGLLKATRLTNFQVWPQQEQANFGEDHIQIVLTHYESILSEQITIDDVMIEFTLLKKHVYDMGVPVGKVTWPHVFSGLVSTCPNVLSVISLLLTLPAHSADCERGFSCMKKIKTDWRSSLKEPQLNDSFRVMLLSPNLQEFDPLPCIKLWNSSAKLVRRPNTVPYGPRKLGNSSDSQSSSGSSSESD